MSIKIDYDRLAEEHPALARFLACKTVEEAMEIKL